MREAQKRLVGLHLEFPFVHILSTFGVDDNEEGSHEDTIEDKDLLEDED